MGVKTTRRRRTTNFYECALDEAERDSVHVAKEVEGIDNEVALLRVRLRTVIEKGPSDFPLMLRGLDALRRLVEVKYRLGQEQSDALGTELFKMRDELIRMVREVRRDGDPGNH